MSRSENRGVDVRALREKDLPAAVVLARNERWNQCEQDWKTVLRLSPNGSFAAWVDRSLIGTVTTFKYGADLAWVGMMIVQREFRARGIGRKLMQAALDHLKACGVSTIKLDATPTGQPLYTSLGFNIQATIHRWEAVLAQAPAPDLGLGGGMNDLRATIHEFDQRAFGISRRQLLNQLIEQCCVVPAVLAGATSGALLGYGLARHGADAFYIGPMVATNDDAAAQILDRLIGQLAGCRVYLDCSHNSPTMQGLLAERGFVKQRSLTRMAYGNVSLVGLSKCLYASAGPELG